MPSQERGLFHVIGRPASVQPPSIEGGWTYLGTVSEYTQRRAKKLMLEALISSQAHPLVTITRDECGIDWIKAVTSARGIEVWAISDRHLKVDKLRLNVPEPKGKVERIEDDGTVKAMAY